MKVVQSEGWSHIGGAIEETKSGTLEKLVDKCFAFLFISRVPLGGLAPLYLSYRCI